MSSSSPTHCRDSDGRKNALLPDRNSPNVDTPQTGDQESRIFMSKSESLKHSSNILEEQHCGYIGIFVRTAKPLASEIAEDSQAEIVVESLDPITVMQLDDTRVSIGDPFGSSLSAVEVVRTDQYDFSEEDFDCLDGAQHGVDFREDQRIAAASDQNKVEDDASLRLFGGTNTAITLNLISH